MNNGVWNKYHIQNALVIIRDGRPKVVCAWFKSDARWNWNWRLQIWEEKFTEAHISVCSRVPAHIARLWTPGARADDPGNRGQGVEGSNTGAASSGGSGWGQGARGSNTGAASSGGSGWGQGVGESNNTGAASSGSAWGQGVGESNTGAASSGGSGGAGAAASSGDSMWL